MAVFNAAFPVLPGKTDQARALAEEVMGARRQQFEESQARIGATRETWCLQSTPDGDFVLVWFEAPDIDKAFASLAESSEPFEVWFRQQVLEVTGTDMAAQPEEQQPTPDVLVDQTA